MHHVSVCYAASAQAWRLGRARTFIGSSRGLMRRSWRAPTMPRAHTCCTWSSCTSRLMRFWLEAQIPGDLPCTENRPPSSVSVSTGSKEKVGGALGQGRSGAQLGPLCGGWRRAGTRHTTPVLRNSIRAAASVGESPNGAGLRRVRRGSVKQSVKAAAALRKKGEACCSFLGLLSRALRCTKI